MSARQAVYTHEADELIIQSNVDGSARTYYITPRKYYGLSLGVDKEIVAVSIGELTANGGVKVVREFSLDGGVKFNSGATVITEKNSNGDYVAAWSQDAERLPSSRLAVVIRDTSGSNQITARLSAWRHYIYA